MLSVNSFLFNYTFFFLKIIIFGGGFGVKLFSFFADYARVYGLFGGYL